VTQPGGLLERAAELAAISGLLELARTGDGGTLLVIGPAGIGKTTLLGSAVASARAAGMRVLAARGRELEEGFSFGVARQLFEPLLAAAAPAERDALLAGAARRALLALNGEAPGAAEQAAHPRDLVTQPLNAAFAVTHGLYWLAVNACAMTPLLVVIDDLQWSDTASAGFIGYLAERLSGLPAALIACWRAGEAGPAAAHLDRLERATPGTALHPAPLSGAAAGELLRACFGQQPDQRFTAACQTVTGGNPFLLRELAASVRADGLGPDGPGADRVAVVGPRPVARSVTLRVARLGPAAAALAQAAAILGDDTELGHAAVLAGLAPPDAAQAAGQLTGIGILEAGTPLRFAHPVVRTALYDDIGPAERGVRHGHAARLLADAGADPQRVCAHLLACEPAGSAAAVGLLRAAAATALGRGAPDSAAAYLRRALAERTEPAGSAELLFELGQAELLTRDPRALPDLRAALALSTDPALRARIAHDIGNLLMHSGQWDAGLAVMRTGISELPGQEDSHGSLKDGQDSTDSQPWRPAATRLLTLWAGFAAFSPATVAEFDQRLPALLHTASQNSIESRLLAGYLAGILASRGERPGQASWLLEHALDGDRLLRQVDSQPLVVAQGLFAAMMLENPSRVAALAERLLAQSRADGSLLGLALGTCLRCAAKAQQGDLPGAESDVRAAVEVGVDHGLWFAASQGLFWGLDALIERDELADLAGLGATIELSPDQMASGSGALVRQVRGRLAVVRGDFAVARDELTAAGATLDALHVRNPGIAWWRGALALALAAEDRAAAVKLADSELADARDMDLIRPAGIALRVRGVLTGGKAGLSDLREAADLLAGTGARLELARALVELGAALRRGNQRAAAREPLSAGLDLARRCGADRLTRQASEELTAAGARPRPAAASGRAALTYAERRVTEMAADGMSNPEIAQSLLVTINTVEGQLRRAFQKLAISSRSQLRDALAGDG
jgi:DNA-binding CsgD family transcriptional regulator